MNGQGNPGVLLIAAGVYVVLALAFIVILIRLLWKLFAGLWRWLARDTSTFGADPRVRLLALGVAVLLYPKTAAQAARGLIDFPLELGVKVPQALLMGWGDQRGVCLQGMPGDCLTSAFFGLVESTGRGVQQAFVNSSLGSLPFGVLLLLLTAWVLGSVVLNAAASPRGAPGAGANAARRGGGFAGWVAGAGRWGGSLVSDRTRVTRQNLLFFLILFVGAYLSFAAIAAIPDLNAEPEALSATMEPESLTARLRGSMRTFPTPQVRRDPLQPLLHLLGEDTVAPPAGAQTRTAAGAAVSRPDTTTRAPAPAAPLDTGRAGTPGDTLRRDTVAGDTVRRDTLPAAAAPPIAATVDSSRLELVGLLVRDLRIDRQQRVKAHNALVIRLNSLQGAALERARAVYAVPGRRVWAREQGQHFQELTVWFIDYAVALDGRAQESEEQLQAFDDQLAAWTSTMRRYLLRPGTDEALFYNLWEVGGRLLQLPRAVGGGTEAALASRVPRRPEPGSNLGLFQNVSGWLLRTESLPLTLIVGMLGFGLLGAAASTFIRERAPAQGAGRRVGGAPHGRRGQRPNAPKQPIVEDLAGVVIRGGTAAFVVFLGVMGGLAIFGAGGQPDPYVLLFTCFAGAVFSERVWNWAEGVLTRRLNDPNGGGGEDGQPAPEEEVVEPQPSREGQPPA